MAQIITPEKKEIHSTFASEFVKEHPSLQDGVERLWEKEFGDIFLEQFGDYIDLVDEEVLVEHELVLVGSCRLPRQSVEGNKENQK